MHGRLAFSLNDDGTVTLRCDADAFFAHANKIRGLLAGRGAEPAAEDDERLAEFWSTVVPAERRKRSRDLSVRGGEVLAACFYLTRERGFDAVTRGDLERVLERAGAERGLGRGTLGHLGRRGWLDRVGRGVYRLSQRGIDRVESWRRLAARPTPAPRNEPVLPSIIGLSRFLREVAAARQWRRVLLVAYFLREHCGTEEFDRRLLEACFKRIRGVDAPGSLAAILSQELCKRRKLVERGSRRGTFRLTAAAVEELARTPRVAQADALHRAHQAVVAKTG